MSGWSGFTEEELKRLKTSPTHENENVKQKKKVKAYANKTAESSSSKDLIVPLSKINQKEIPSWDVPHERSKCELKSSEDPLEEVKRTEKTESKFELKAQVESSIKASELPESEKSYPMQKEEKPEPNNAPAVSATENPINTSETDKTVSTIENVIAQRPPGIDGNERTSLEELHAQQKLIEDENKKKQQLIKQTLQQRFKETQDEATKLKEVQTQLKRLDKLLQKDVDILREKIENATLSFAQAEQRFQNAEKEYVEAKIDYYKKQECKEQLTEHLYTIIQENEIRKSKKLEELLMKLHGNKKEKEQRSHELFNSYE